jgi:membrane protein YdbS with pleckstrin-like domain
MLFYIATFDSPFIVPVAAFAMVLGIIIAAQVAEYNKRRLQSEERLAAIAKGIPLPPEQLVEPMSNEAAQRRRARGLRTAAIVLISVSLGTALFAFLLVWILQENDILSLAALSVVPLAIGIGLFVDYRLQTRELEQLSADSSSLTPTPPRS